MRRTLIIGFCLLVMVLTACSVPGTPAVQEPVDVVSGGSNGPVRIGFGASEFERSRYQPIIDAFNAANPDIAVQFVPIEPNFGSGQLNQDWLSEIASQADTFTSMLIGEQDLRSGLLTDLKPLADADPQFGVDDFQPGALLGEADGGMYLLPDSLNLQLLSYNRALWDAAGLAEPVAGWSWDDLLAAAEQVARPDAADPRYGIDDGRDGLLVLQGLLAEAGITLSPDNSGQIRLDQPEATEILARVADLIERGVIYQRPLSDGSVSFEEIGAHIREGRVAMWLGGSVMLGGAFGGEPAAIDVGTAALPILPRNAILNRSGYVMSGGTAHPEAAWRWLSYLSRRQPSNDGAMMVIGLGFTAPARISFADAAGFWESRPADEVAALQTTLEQLERAPAAVSPQVIGNLMSALSAVRNGSTPELALADAQANLDRQLSEQSAAPRPQAPAVQLPIQPTAPAGATEIGFGAFGGDPAVLRELADRFNQQQSDAFVTVEPPTFDGGQFSPATMSERFACFVWPGAPQPEDHPALRDIQPLLDSDATFDQADYPAALLAPYRDGGALYGLPYAVQLRTLNYNRTLFDSAGLEAPRADWDTADLLEAARVLSGGAGDEQRYGYAVDGAHTADLLAFLRMAGAEAVLDGAPRFEDAAVVQAIQRYLELLSYSPHTKLEGYSNSGFAGATALSLGQQGRLGMWPSGGFGNGMFVFHFGDPQGTPADLAVAPPPLGGRSLSSADLSASSLLISAQAGEAEVAACWEWLKFLSAQSSGLEDRFPARNSVATSDAFLAQARPGAAELYAAYADALADNTRTADPYAGIDLFWLVQAVDRALQGEDLERALAEAQITTENYLACVAVGDAPDACASAVDPEYDGIGPR